MIEVALVLAGLAAVCVIIAAGVVWFVTEVTRD
jgi:hypothetical protein